MRILSFRLILSLIFGITVVSVLYSYYEVQVQEHGLRGDLERRAAVLGESLSGNVERSMEQASPGELQRLVERFGNREHLAGIAVYDVLGNPIAITPALAKLMEGAPPAVVQAVRDDRAEAQFTRAGTASIHIYAVPLHNSRDQIEGGLAIVNDTGYIAAQTRRVWRETFLRVLAEMVLIALVTLLILRWSLSGPIARAAQWMRALRTGRASARHSAVPDWDVFQPLAREVATFAESLKHARSAAETEAQLREAAESIWTADRLAVHVRSKLGNSRLVAVSNREPYFHSRRGKNLEIVVPASGLVTALEPVLQACDGTWIAHGSGDADRETVDLNDRLRVPPDDPRYTLRRLWLSQEEEEGYYYGFANEGLWPLCHIAHTRPLFRASDWSYY